MTPKVICEIRFETNLAGFTPGYAIVQGVDGRFFLNGYADIVSGRGWSIRAWLTCNGAFRDLARYLRPALNPVSPIS